MRAALLLAVLQTAVLAAHGARILGLFSDICRSHTTQNRPLFRALAARGHHVTLLTGFGDAEPVANYSDVVVEGVTGTVAPRLDFPGMAALSNQIPFGEDFQRVMEQSFTSNGTQTLLKSTEKFDLIFIDITLAHFYLGFVPKFGNPPFIAVIPSGPNDYADLYAGNPDSPSFMPSSFFPFSSSKNFFDRFVNTAECFVARLFAFWMHFPNMDRHMRAHFGEAAPSVRQIARNVSLVMVNTHVGQDLNPRPLTPQTIEIGGLYQLPAKPLPPDLQQFLDDASDGAILCSLDPMPRGDRRHSDTLRAIVGALRALRQRVLWQWEPDLPVDLSANVMARRWLPLNDVLAHRNVKLLVTSAGIGSVEEAVFHGVPMVAVPVTGEQSFQADTIVSRGFGVKVDFQKLYKRVLIDAITEVLGNSSYTTKIARIGRISRDKLRTPLETAIFWTEYVLRNGGAHHLRTAGVDMSWYRYLLLDVLAAMMLALVMPLGALMLLMRRVLVAARGKRVHDVRQPIVVLSKEH